MLGFALTNNLGEYLGVPLHHDKVNKNTYNFLLDNMQNKISDSKAKNLSFACRNTLACFVLNGISLYCMQADMIPFKTREEIVKNCCDFFLGHKSDEKRLIFCLGRRFIIIKRIFGRKGGLALRKAKDINTSMLMKIRWGWLRKEISYRLGSFIPSISVAMTWSLTLPIRETLLTFGKGYVDLGTRSKTSWLGL